MSETERARQRLDAYLESCLVGPRPANYHEMLRLLEDELLLAARKEVPVF